ncbi:DUF4250 domain-containing protein [Leptotrichia sp. OH3620_COT-345]|uniref:DUF4250 domain-containing protein n=1 Tax=Leptotrichia sp. OH3620_COT-345 TaxID=2491048 RepID=UPI000F64B59F|nr:DUF4250 domain-containing protein [Leptotrichia sp. OH3620_COT-345]RRD39132.1 DUF4250 domain-containing protein [Leptotrichia sp. OH3620_COT-345]
MFNFESGDINMMLSLLNMKLRDEFSDLDKLIGYYSLNKEIILKRMEKEGYFYNEEVNQFRKI